jgi:lipoate-protein ligase A
MDCAFHFAAEEYVMEALGAGAGAPGSGSGMSGADSPALMLWRTDRTVMLGANQIAEIEADIAYAKAHGIAIVRRSSGGGAIYTDPGTLLYTIILPFTERTDTKAVIADYLAGPVIRALGRMGVGASLEGRNDILVGGKKIAGIAQYVRHGFLCSHGSLLFDADLAELARVLTADDAKIVSKALRSVRSRVTNIAEHLPGGGGGAKHADDAGTLGEVGAADADPVGGRAHAGGDELTRHDAEQDRPGIRAFIERLRESWDEEFGLMEYEFTADDLAEIERIRASKYANDAWTYGRAPRYSYRNAKRFAGGGVEVFADVKNGVIERMKITGDFLALRPVAELEEKLAGTPFRAEALAAAVTEDDVSRALGSVTKGELLSVLKR